MWYKRHFFCQTMYIYIYWCTFWAAGALWLGSHPLNRKAVDLNPRTTGGTTEVLTNRSPGAADNCFTQVNGSNAKDSSNLLQDQYSMLNKINFSYPW